MNTDLKFNDKFEAYCYDCGRGGCQKRIVIKGKQPINGKMLTFNVGEETHVIFKCDDCFQKQPDSIKRNGQDCEVYSRVVGYYRPIQQWHKGKQEEYKERKNFSLSSLPAGTQSEGGSIKDAA